jgi:hypothetical protein
MPRISRGLQTVFLMQVPASTARQAANRDACAIDPDEMLTSRPWSPSATDKLAVDLFSAPPALPARRIAR